MGSAIRRRARGGGSAKEKASLGGGGTAQRHKRLLRSFLCLSGEGFKHFSERRGTSELSEK
eukprot:6267659-Pyramimonas_sp.AAC.1